MENTEGCMGEQAKYSLTSDVLLHELVKTSPPLNFVKFLGDLFFPLRVLAGKP